MTKLHLIAAAIAIAAAPVAFAQTTTGTPQNDTTAQQQAQPTPSTQPGAGGTTSGGMGGTGSPSTPPTHPTERSTPSTTVPNTAGTPKPGGTSGMTEAQQACKNLTAAEERKACMDKAARETGSSPSSKSTQQPSGTSQR